MILKVFAVYDSKVEAYMPPFFMSSRGQAMRSFGDTADDSSTQLFKHPEDFSLFELGEWVDNTGFFSLYDHPIPLGKALELRSKSLS